MGYKSKGLEVRMLSRSFNPAVTRTAAGEDDDLQISIPKKTKMFVEQAQRERENAQDMYRAYQKDLMKLRLRTAQAYFGLLSDANAHVSLKSGVTLRVNVQVEGLGPLFKLRTRLENSGGIPYVGLGVFLSYDQTLYTVISYPKSVPIVLPNGSYAFDIIVESIDQNGTNGLIKVFVADTATSAAPLVGAIVQMPISEARME
eukprot:TRINITY_DN4491_c0_g2_i5.p1 TRINITY_DN4491_c0_g2~~TRINITY_DN4491_c0_g2_i5.p1  ORF type:complete len:202 (+),score=32.97 TRINITY_DN4491_c0_g2_i5:72-677(+)